MSQWLADTIAYADMPILKHFVHTSSSDTLLLEAHAALKGIGAFDLSQELAQRTQNTTTYEAALEIVLQYVRIEEKEPIVFQCFDDDYDNGDGSYYDYDDDYYDIYGN